MSERLHGLVVDKFVDEPLHKRGILPGWQSRLRRAWTFAIVELPSHERVTVRLGRQYADRIAIGDHVASTKFWRANKPVNDVEIVRDGGR